MIYFLNIFFNIISSFFFKIDHEFNLLQISTQNMDYFIEHYMNKIIDKFNFYDHINDGNQTNHIFINTIFMF